MCATWWTRIGVLAALAGAARVAVGQGAPRSDPWAAFQPGTLGAIVQQHDSLTRAVAAGADSTIALSYESFPTRAQVTYLGETRPLPPGHRRVIGAWLRTQGLDSASGLAMYDREVRVREASREFWLPVQRMTWEQTQELWHCGQAITVLTRWVGARVQHQVPDWIFLIMTVEPSGP